MRLDETAVAARFRGQRDARRRAYLGTCEIQTTSQAASAGAI